MGWFKRLFGQDKPDTPEQPMETVVQKATEKESIPPERVGPNGKYDQSGLAKRVAFAFDGDSQLDDVETLWVAQTGGTVVLKGKVPSQEFLDRAKSVASKQTGATGVNTDEVTIG